MKYRDVLFRLGRIASIVHPRIDLICQRVAFQMKNRRRKAQAQQEEAN